MTEREKEVLMGFEWDILMEKLGDSRVEHLAKLEVISKDEPMVLKMVDARVSKSVGMKDVREDMQLETMSVVSRAAQ